MNTVARTPRNPFPSFAGVALADILANSVAIVIIMIVVMFIVGHKQERDKLEQTEDVAVLLSRELASSFVMNALPTSPPAQLHDYVASPLDRNPHHSTMPIVELHAEFVRDYYTGKRYARDALLRQNNAFDAYLASLRPNQLAAIRVDVYSTRLFYIAMSILKAHGQTPRHWHFLGAAAGAGPGSGGNAPALTTRPWQRSPAQPADGLADAARLGKIQTPTNAPPIAWPEDVALTAAGAGGYGESEPSGFGGRPYGPTLDLPGQLEDAANGRDGETGAEATAADRPRDGSGAGTGTNDGAGAASGGTRFRAAAPERPSPLLASAPALNLPLALHGLWIFMAAEQTAADNGLPSRLPQYDFLSHVLAAAPDANGGASTLSKERAQALSALGLALRAPQRSSAKPVTLRAVRSEAVRGQAIAFFPNEPVTRGLWLRDAEQLGADGLTDATVTLRLGLHAAIHEGVRATLDRGSVVLTPWAEAVPDSVPKWRVVTLASAARDDFVTGFLYGAVDAAGRLVLPVNENAVAINGTRVESRFPPVPLRVETRRLGLFGAVVALLAACWVLRHRRPA